MSSILNQVLTQYQELKVLKSIVFQRTQDLKNTRRIFLRQPIITFLQEFKKDRSIKWVSKHFMIENLLQHTQVQVITILRKISFQSHTQWEDEIRTHEMIGLLDQDLTKLKITTKRSKGLDLIGLSEIHQLIINQFILRGLHKKFKSEMMLFKITDLSLLFQKTLEIKTTFKDLKVFECNLVLVITITKMLLEKMVPDTQWKVVDQMSEFYLERKETVQELTIQILQQRRKIRRIKWVKVQKDEFQMYMVQLLHQTHTIQIRLQLKNMQQYLVWVLVIDLPSLKFLKLPAQDNTPLVKNLQKPIQWMVERKCTLKKHLDQVNTHQMIQK